MVKRMGQIAVLAMSIAVGALWCGAGDAGATGSPPGQPVLSAPTPGVGQATLSWSKPSSNGATITSYRVYRGTVWWNLSYIGSVSGTVATNTGLTNGTTYYYGVAAVNSRGIGAMSNVMSVTPGGAPDTPQISSTAPGNSSVQLTWTAPGANGSPITGYQIHMGTSQSALNVIATVGATGAYNATGLVNGTTYYFAITAINGFGTSNRSPVVSNVPSTVPSGPVLSQVTAGPGAGAATLTWLAPQDNGSPITGYQIHRGTSPANLTLLTSIGPATSFTATGLTNGVTYSFAVVAVNARGTSIRSNIVTHSPSIATTTTMPPTTAPSTSLPPGNVNNPNYWSALGYGYCFKNDHPSTPYSLGQPPNGWYWTLLVLKAGSEASNSDWLTQIPNPLPGPYYHPSGKQISHVIYCKKPNSSSTTAPNTTTTIVGSGCDDYTPTSLRGQQHLRRARRVGGHQRFGRTGGQPRHHHQAVRPGSGHDRVRGGRRQRQLRRAGHHPGQLSARELHDHGAEPRLHVPCRADDHHRRRPQRRRR